MDSLLLATVFRLFHYYCLKYSSSLLIHRVLELDSSCLNNYLGDQSSKESYWKLRDISIYRQLGSKMIISFALL